MSSLDDAPPISATGRRWRRGAALAGIASIAVGAWLATRRGSEPPSVVLITVDTLRSDALGCYGNEATRTPNIDRLADEGLLFERAVSPLPETRPAHLSIFTSLYPRDHGVLSNSSAFGSEAQALPEIYARGGYSTAGFAGCALFDAAAGERLGFGHFDAPDKPQRAAHEVVGAAVRWLESTDPSRPVFVWLHLFDPHMPYEPPPPFNASGRPEMVASWPKFTWPELLACAAEHDGNLPREVFERARALYRGEVEYADHWLGAFFSALARVGRWDRSVVLLTSDHGECFSRGVFFDHSHCLNEGALAVPLILRYPPSVAAGRRISAQVELMDIAPTLLRLGGLPIPEGYRGVDLLARGQSPPDPAGLAPYAFFQHPLYRRSDVEDRQDVLRRLRAVGGEPTRPIVGDQLQLGAASGGWKYVRRGADEELYDLHSDLSESNNLAAEEIARLGRFRGAVRRWLEERPLRLEEDAEIDPEMMKNLRALGYL